VTLRVRGSKRHRVGIIDFASPGLVVPLFEQRNRFVDAGVGALFGLSAHLS